MTKEEIKIGKWYMIKQYGFSFNIKGKVVDICQDRVTFKFYWGAPFRTRQVILLDNILDETNPPSLFSNY